MATNNETWGEFSPEKGYEAVAGLLRKGWHHMSFVDGPVVFTADASMRAQFEQRVKQDPTFAAAVAKYTEAAADDAEREKNDLIKAAVDRYATACKQVKLEGYSLALGLLCATLDGGAPVLDTSARDKLAALRAEYEAAEKALLDALPAEHRKTPLRILSVYDGHNRVTVTKVSPTDDAKPVTPSGQAVPSMKAEPKGGWARWPRGLGYWTLVVVTTVLLAYAKMRGGYGVSWWAVTGPVWVPFLLMSIAAVSALAVGFLDVAAAELNATAGAYRRGEGRLGDLLVSAAVHSTLAAIVLLALFGGWCGLLYQLVAMYVPG